MPDFLNSFAHNKNGGIKIRLEKINEIVEQIFPIRINPTYTSVTIGLSKRFFIFQIIKEMIKKIEDDPYLNFISILKHYKLLGKFLSGTIHELYRDRNKSYFRHFFEDKSLYELVRADIEWIYSKNKSIKLAVTKNGIIIYDLYKKNKFNMLLLTVHSGTWVPKSIEKKFSIKNEERLLEEDIGAHKVYGNLFLEKGGIWIDSKISRFACDFNRSAEKAIYSNKSEPWLGDIWKENPSRHQKMYLGQVYREFYFTLEHLADAYKFNIIFDAHSMRNSPERPEISFGTKFIPRFYMPVIRSMQKKLVSLGYHSVLFNTPYSGGYILEWLSSKFPDLFVFSMEVNKKLYMDETEKSVVSEKLLQLSDNIVRIFDIEE